MRLSRRRFVMGTAGVGLLATSAWLIARAAERPGAAALGVAIAGVQFFALTRALGRYFDGASKHTQAVRDLIKQVGAGAASVTVPNLNDSLQAVHNYKSRG